MSPLFDLLLVLLDALRHRVEVGQDQLGRDDLDVADRVERAHGVDGVIILEAADDMDDGVDLADVGQELVAEAVALAGAGDESGDVDEFDGGRDDRAGVEDLFQTGRRSSGTVTTPTLGSMVQNG